MKITLVDFFKGEPACIQAKTFEQACKLCKAFHEMGKKWSAGNSYLDDILYAEYESETVYYNDCSMSSRLYWCSSGNHHPLHH